VCTTTIYKPDDDAVDPFTNVFFENGAALEEHTCARVFFLFLTMSHLDQSTHPCSFAGKDMVDFAMTGEGSVDGQGLAWWAVTHNDLTYRPGMIALQNVSGLTITGVQLLNSPNHNIFVDSCEHVRVSRLRVNAPANSPNTDGINFGGGNDQSIVDSVISNGDDCVSVVAVQTPGARASHRRALQPFVRRHFGPIFGFLLPLAVS
jgi:polygalacturonase